MTDKVKEIYSSLPEDKKEWTSEFEIFKADQTLSQLEIAELLHKVIHQIRSIQYHHEQNQQMIHQEELYTFVANFIELYTDQKETLQKKHSELDKMLKQFGISDPELIGELGSKTIKSLSNLPS